MRVAQERVATRMEQKTEVRQEVPAGARAARVARATARRALVRAPITLLTHSSLRETARRRGESCA